MKVLVTGAGGMLGSCLVEKLKESHQVIATEQYPNNYNVVCMDITSPSKVKKVTKEWEPDFVIHCAAMTDVDGCETDPQSAFAVNGVGTYNVAMACELPRPKGQWLPASFAPTRGVL